MNRMHNHSFVIAEQETIDKDGLSRQYFKEGL